jgi:ABC-type transporter Mla MlaB component
MKDYFVYLKKNGCRQYARFWPRSEKNDRILVNAILGATIIFTSVYLFIKRVNFCIAVTKIATYRADAITSRPSPKQEKPMVQAEPKDHSTDSKLILAGDLTVHRMIEVQRELKKHISRAKILRLDISAAADMDLSFLQLLCSAHRTAVGLGRSLELTGGLPEIFSKTVNDGGFVRHIGCTLNCNGSCIWSANNPV